MSTYIYTYFLFYILRYGTVDGDEKVNEKFTEEIFPGVKTFLEEQKIKWKTMNNLKVMFLYICNKSYHSY